jgi:hypothetical protein
MKHRTATLAAFLLLSACAVFAYASLTSEAASRRVASPEPQRRARQRQQQRRRAPAARAPRVDYSKFTHRTAAHQRSCDSCHTSPTPNWSRARAGEAAFPDVTDYPEHESCMNCHRQQFFVGARPVICSVCHTNVSPRDGTRHPFRNPPEGFEAGAGKKPRPASEFATVFPHDRHQDVMARLATPPEPSRDFGFVRASFAAPQGTPKKAVDSCTICHQTFQPQGDLKEEFVIPAPADLPKNALGVGAFWMKKGTLKTTPTSHASCFNCHWQDGGEQPLSSNCAGCHKLVPPGAVASALKPARADADLDHASAKGVADKEMLAHWARRKSATFRHEEGSHLTVGCTSCHINITAVNRLDADTLDVPIQTCSATACHGARTGVKSIIFKEVEQRKKPDGASYQCIKCHLGYGKEPTPPSHSNLFPPPKPK